MKSVKGATKGKNGKDGKGNDSKGKNGKDSAEKVKVEPCYFFTESEDGCKNGQQCTKYHRMLKPEEKRCYACGGAKHMAG